VGGLEYTSLSNRIRVYITILAFYDREIGTQKRGRRALLERPPKARNQRGSDRGARQRRERIRPQGTEMESFFIWILVGLAH